MHTDNMEVNNIEGVFLVGGAVRDEILGVPTKDFDFTVVAYSEADSFPDAPAPFDAMRNFLLGEGAEIFVESPEHLTMRARLPNDHLFRVIAGPKVNTFDFVLARRDSPGSDGRRPDFVEVGTLDDDLARRDFTVNAIARNPYTGALIDPSGGLDDLRARRLRFVGDPEQRITEDGLRVLRGFRFMVTKGLHPDHGTLTHMTRPLAVDMLTRVSVERIREELERMFRHDTRRTLDLIGHTMPPEMVDVLFDKGLRLTPTLAQ